MKLKTFWGIEVTDFIYIRLPANKSNQKYDLGVKVSSERLSPFMRVFRKEIVGLLRPLWSQSYWEKTEHEKIEGHGKNPLLPYQTFHRGLRRFF